MIGVFALNIAAGVLSFLIFASYTKRATVVGRLMPDSGQTTLVAAQSGRLAEIKVTEGAKVKSGDVLFVLSLDRDGERVSHEGAVAEKLQLRKMTLDVERAQQQSLASAEATRLHE